VTSPSRQGLGGVHRVAALLVPWVFLIVFVTLVRLFLWPQVLEGKVLAMCLGAFILVVLTSFTLAAVTFSRDVLSGRYPGES
jgi:hypothetical protein